MSNELFFDINEEQQEAVAGGESYGSIYDEIYTYFKQDNKYAMLDFNVASTPVGSVVNQKFAFDRKYVDTYAEKYFEFFK